MNMLNDADIKLLEGCKAGKRHFQSLLYNRYARSLFAVCLRYSGNHAAAEDLLQDCFIKIFRNIVDFRGEGSLEGWMKRIVINTALTEYRKKSKNLVFIGIDSIGEVANEEESDADFSLQVTPENAKKLMSFIQKLPAGYKHVFNLYVFEDYTHKEISEALGISANTSKSQLAKARKFLQKQLSDNKLIKH
jgi:RNA polymerase sigma factor (sigma-70 family)